MTEYICPLYPGGREENTKTGANAFPSHDNNMQAVAEERLWQLGAVAAK